MLELSVVGLLIGTVGINVAGSILLKSAAAASSAFLAAAGCACFVIGAALYINLLAQRDLGVLAVITSSLGLVAVVLYSAVVLQEVITARMWVGIAITLIGMVVISLPTAPR